MVQGVTHHDNYHQNIFLVLGFGSGVGTRVGDGEVVIVLELLCLSCIIMFRWVNKQPGIQTLCNYAVSIKIAITEYHHCINCSSYDLF